MMFIHQFYFHSNNWYYIVGVVSIFEINYKTLISSVKHQWATTNTLFSTCHTQWNQR